MRALVYHGNRDLRLETAPEPLVGPGQVKLAVDFCGICATDIEEYLHGPLFISSDAPNPITGSMAPLVTGHEVTGTVIEKGPGVTDLELGDRVALNGVLSCGTCRWCQQGDTTQCPSRRPWGSLSTGDWPRGWPGALTAL